MPRRQKTIPDIDRFKSMLKSKKMRATPQRLAVHTAMMALVHASPDEVYEWIAKECDTAISLSSIYNILNDLAAAGIYRYRLSADNKLYFDVCNFTHPHIYDRKNNIFKDLRDDDLISMMNSYLKTHRVRGYKVEDIDVQIVCRPSRSK